MKAFSVFKRCSRQLLRDRLGLALTLLTAPFFVLFYWAVFDDGTTPVKACIDGPADVVESMTEILGPDTRIDLTNCTNDGSYLVQASVGDIGARGPVEIRFAGDASDPRFPVTTARLHIAFDAHVAADRGEAPRVRPVLEPTGNSANLTPFDLYVPNLLIFALIMLVFSTAMNVAREIERGTLERLRLTRMRTSDYLAGVAASQLWLGALAIAATLGTALALGFTTTGSLLLATVVAMATALASIGVGVLTASLARSVSRAFVIASFFMFLLVLFSGLVFPIPNSTVFDAIPTVHAARALHSVLVLDASVTEIGREIAFLGGLSAACFAAGALRFRMVHSSFLQEST